MIVALLGGRLAGRRLLGVRGFFGFVARFGGEGIQVMDYCLEAADQCAEAGFVRNGDEVVGFIEHFADEFHARLIFHSSLHKYPCEIRVRYRTASSNTPCQGPEACETLDMGVAPQPSVWGPGVLGPLRCPECGLVEGHCGEPICGIQWKQRDWT